MAAIKSLGLHEPSALPYLIAEAILPPDPPKTSYRWQTKLVHDDKKRCDVQEELLITDTCVLWSVEGTIQRVYNVSVEGEKILHALTTRFAVGHKTPAKSHRDSHARHGSAVEILERALVIVLRSQGLIFLSSGDSHVLPLSFETHAAFASPRGFFLQSKVDEENDPRDGPDYDQQPLQSSFTAKTKAGLSRPSLVLPHDEVQNAQRETVSYRSAPRTFYYTDILSEIGLIIVTPSSRIDEVQHTTAEPTTLDRNESIVYVTSSDDAEYTDGPQDSPTCLAVSHNAKQSTFTVWEVILRRPEISGRSTADLEVQNITRKPSKKVSDAHSRSVAGPIPGNPSTRLRESFGALAQPHADNSLNQESFSKRLSQVEDLEAQLGAEFGTTGVQTRSSRRVSSMMARADLAPGHERSTFHEFSTGAAGRKSLNRSGHRGESTGSFSERHSFGARRRSSFPTHGSMASTGTSFLTLNTHRPIGELDIMENFVSNAVEPDNDWSELPKEVQFVKVKTIASTGMTSGTANMSDDIKVFTLPFPNAYDVSDESPISICLMNRHLHELTVVTLSQRSQDNARRPNESLCGRRRFKMKDVQRADSIVDACKLSDAGVSRILIQSLSRDGRHALHLEARWSPPWTVHLPSEFAVFDPYMISFSGSTDRRRETGLNRIINSRHMQPKGLHSTGNHQFSIEDSEETLHRLALHLQPRSPAVAFALNICEVVVSKRHYGLRVAWWEAINWLKTQNYDHAELEWTALIIVLFSLALPFLSESGSVNTSNKKRRSMARSSNGLTSNLPKCSKMEELQVVANPSKSSWNWLINLSEQKSTTGPTSSSHTRKSSTSAKSDSSDTVSDLIKWIALARDFLQSPGGEAAIGAEGYLPTAMNQDRHLRQTSLAAILVGLHLAREEQKLDVNKSAMIAATFDLAPVLAQIGFWLGWNDWSWQTGTYYNGEISDASCWIFDEARIVELQCPAQPFPPPSIFRYVEEIILSSSATPFPTLMDVMGYAPKGNTADPLQIIAAELTPRTLCLLSFLTSVGKKVWDRKLLTRMVELGIDASMLRSLPDGIAAIFHQIIVSHRGKPATSSPSVLRLLQREEQSPSFNPSLRALQTSKRPQATVHDAIRDYHTTISQALQTDTIRPWEPSHAALRSRITNLIFTEDRRLLECQKLVDQSRPPEVICESGKDWTEAQLLDAQKELAQDVGRRTLSVATGRGLLLFTILNPLLTERITMPPVEPHCIIRARYPFDRSPMTVSADKSLFTEDKACWSYFHNGAAAGLNIAIDAKGVDTSWILYNKPAELTNRHAGLLLGLGLNGHLKSLAKWVAFKYLTPKHTMTSIGLLLGLSASYLGTMDTLITRLLSVHVSRLLPPGAAELNLNPLTQTSGIMGVGLVYLSSGHRRMSEVMVSEIENRDLDEPGGGVPPTGNAGSAGEDSALRDEGYRLAAGFSLGLINLGKGKSLDGLRDMNLLERLLGVAIGTKNVDFVNVLDRATAGAVIAIALVWLKTGDDSIARKIDIPDTIHQFDYVRPDIFLLRTLAKHLILWDRIEASEHFVERSLPQVYRRRASLEECKHLSSEDMPFFNIVAGICFAIGLRYAGSFDTGARNLLIAYLDQFIRLTRLPALNYDAKLTRNSVRNCQDIVALSAAAVMAGSGDLEVYRRLRSLHGRVDPDTPYGSHLAAHMAIGALFLSQGTATFGTSNIAVAGLIIGFYPVFPTSVLDNKAHLQALRHLWVLAVERRCVVGRDVGSTNAGWPVPVEMELAMKDGTRRTIMTPKLLPDLDTIEKLEVKSGDYWDVSLDFTLPEVHERFKGDQSVWLKRRAAYDRPENEVFVAEMLALDEASEVPSGAATGVGVMTADKRLAVKSPFEWIFGLETFREFDQSERALVLPPFEDGGLGGGGGEGLLKGSVVDARLELERGVIGTDEGGARERDRLWQLRLLFAWVERWDREEKEEKRRMRAAGESEERRTEPKARWLRREVIERLRWRVWKMAGGDDGDGDA